MDLIDIFRTFHPNAGYTFFSSAHRTFSRIDYILGHKANLSKFKKIEIFKKFKKIVYMEFRKMVMITLYVRQQKRHRCKKWTFGLCGRKQGWDDLKE